MRNCFDKDIETAHMVKNTLFRKKNFTQNISQIIVRQVFPKLHNKKEKNLQFDKTRKPCFSSNIIEHLLHSSQVTTITIDFGLIAKTKGKC